MKRRQRAKGRKSRVVMVWLVIMGAFIAQLLIYTWCRVQYVRIGYEITNAAKHRAELLALKRNLSIELARLKSPERIEGIAKRQLGLVTPRPEQVFTIP